MTTTLKDLIGDIFQKGVEGKVGLKEMDGVKFVCLFYSGHWSPPCRGFFSVLKSFYNEVNAKIKQVEILFVSYDGSIDGFEHYIKQMPWVGIPYEDTRMNFLKQRYGISGIPTLLVLQAGGEVVTIDGKTDIENHGIDAIQVWEKIVEHDRVADEEEGGGIAQY